MQQSLLATYLSAKTTDDIIRNLRRQTKYKKDICLRILEGNFHLSPFEVFVFCNVKQEFMSLRSELKERTCLFQSYWQPHASQQ